jgi:Zn-dependent protease
MRQIMYQNTPDSQKARDARNEYPEYVQGAQEIDYSNPDFYQEQVVPPASQRAQEAQPKQEHSSTYASYPEYAGYAEYKPTIQTDPYTQEQNHISPEGPPIEVSTNEYSQQGNEQQAEEKPTPKRGLAGIGSSLLVTGALLLKFGLASISILASVFVYSLFYGWVFAIGIVIQLFIHEMGHALVMKIKGIPMGGLIFIPLLGAAVTMNQMPQNARDEAEVGIAGPIAGTLAASFCLIMAHLQPGPSIWAPLAYFGFFINLFNLVPIVPFDGGRVLAAIDKRVWFLGFIALLGFFVWQWLVGGNFSPWLLLFVVLAAGQLWSRGMAPATSESKAYYTVSMGSRIALTLLYFGLIVVLVLAMSITHTLMPLPN